MRKFWLLTATMALGTGTAFAQVEEEGLVNVNVENILPDLAIGLPDERPVPRTVRVPSTVAAEVCGIDSSVLAVELTEGNAYCEAIIGSPELALAVERVMAQGYTVDGTLTGSTEEEESNFNLDDDDDDDTDGDDTDGDGDVDDDDNVDDDDVDDGGTAE